MALLGIVLLSTVQIAILTLLGLEKKVIILAQKCNFLGDNLCKKGKNICQKGKNSVLRSSTKIMPRNTFQVFLFISVIVAHNKFPKFSLVRL